MICRVKINALRYELLVVMVFVREWGFGVIFERSSKNV